ncbi:MAG: GH36 C-terminal domain-containing protein [Butyricimonas faecihominis]
MHVGKDQQQAILYAYDLYPRFGESLIPVKLQGLDPTQNYKIEEINLMPRRRSSLKAQGKTYSGDYLMKVGIEVFTTNKTHSRILEITALYMSARTTLLINHSAKLSPCFLRATSECP